MTQKLKEKIDQTLEVPDPSWSQKSIDAVQRAMDKIGPEGMKQIVDKVSAMNIPGPTLEQYIQQMEAIQGPEDWERLVSIQCDHEGMNQLLFTEDGDIRHINGYQQGK